MQIKLCKKSKELIVAAINMFGIEYLFKIKKTIQNKFKYVSFTPTIFSKQ